MESPVNTIKTNIVCVCVCVCLIRSGLLPWRRSNQRRPWGLVNTHIRGRDGWSFLHQLESEDAVFRVVALATVAGLIGGGGAVRCLMQTEGIHTHTHTHTHTHFLSLTYTHMLVALTHILTHSLTHTHTHIALHTELFSKQLHGIKQSYSVRNAINYRREKLSLAENQSGPLDVVLFFVCFHWNHRCNTHTHTHAFPDLRTSAQEVRGQHPEH